MSMNSKIKVVGVGGSGSNAISRMMRSKIQGVDLISINADLQDLNKAQAHIKIEIGKKLTGGLGAGMNPNVGRLAAEENRADIEEVLKDSDLVFIACGLGGGCGTGAAPVVAEIAKKGGALTIAVVTKPFSFEGSPRKKIAETGLEALKNKVDSLMVIPNDKLLKIANEKISVSAAFSLCDEILKQAVQGISDLISLPGIVNVDFADLKTVMGNSGAAIFGVGIGKGENRVEEAVHLALRSPLLEDIPLMKGGRAVLINVSGGKDLALSEIQDAVEMIKADLNPRAKLIFGAVEDKKLKEGEIKIAIFITGFEKG
ncbi:cell division protein FtsZ [Patescibacteria group bacterium]|nr:cell division protein FtsZ [Patescibacteria group bacterium]